MSVIRCRGRLTEEPKIRNTQLQKLTVLQEVKKCKQFERNERIVFCYNKNLSLTPVTFFN